MSIKQTIKRVLTGLPLAGHGFERLFAARRLRIKQAGQEKPYSGSAFDRFRGLEPLFADCAGCAVLDFGCCDGRIAYEFARHGARLVHGFDIDRPMLEFAQRLFHNVPVEHALRLADLAVPAAEFERRHSGVLLPEYDIVLFLGMYHHLELQMTAEDIAGLVTHLARKAGRFMAVRTRLLGEVEPLVLAAGLREVSSLPRVPGAPGVGPVKIYARETRGAEHGARE